jgi:hypothetical protein
VPVQIEDELHVEGGLLRAVCSCDAVKTGCEREKCVEVKEGERNMRR